MSRMQSQPRRDGVLILGMVGVFIAGLTAGSLLFTFGSNPSNGLRRWQASFGFLFEWHWKHHTPIAPTTPIDVFRLIRQEPPSRGRVRLPSFNSHAIKITWAPSGALSVCSCRRQEPFSASIRLADHSDGATGGKLSDSAARETSP